MDQRRNHIPVGTLLQSPCPWVLVYMGSLRNSSGEHTLRFLCSGGKGCLKPEAWSLKPEARLTSGNQHQTSPSLSPQKGGLGPELLPHIHPYISLEVPSGSLSSRMADLAGHGEKETNSSQGLPSQFSGDVFKYLEAKWWTYKIKMIRGFFSYVSWPKALIKNTISSNLVGHLLRVLVTTWWQSTLRYQRSLPFDAEGIPRSAAVPACRVLVK